MDHTSNYSDFVGNKFKQFIYTVNRDLGLYLKHCRWWTASFRIKVYRVPTMCLALSSFFTEHTVWLVHSQIMPTFVDYSHSSHLTLGILPQARAYQFYSEGNEGPEEVSHLVCESWPRLEPLTYNLIIFCYTSYSKALRCSPVRLGSKSYLTALSTALVSFC